MTDPYSTLIVCGGLLFATPLLFGVLLLVLLVFVALVGVLGKRGGRG